MSQPYNLQRKIGVFFQNLTDANEAYEAQIKDLQRNLDDAVSQMDRTTEDYLKLKVYIIKFLFFVNL